MTTETEASGEVIDFHLGEPVVRLRDVHMLIRSIFKARGTCVECKHYVDNRKCKMHSVDAEADVIMLSIDSCSYFERKET